MIKNIQKKLEQKLNNIIVYILDDKYWESLFLELRDLYPNFEFPISENIFNPLDYIDEIIKIEPDYILLDHWFVDNYWEENPLWIRFLKELKEKLTFIEIKEKTFFWFIYKKENIKKIKKIKTKIISISDNWKILKDIDLYKEFIEQYVVTKKWQDIIFD